jgi:hypothetical protein
MSASGADSVSAAINVTLPIVESPVVKGLPEIQAALINTGSKIVTAADRYAETDQLLGEHLGKVQFLAAREPAATEQPASAAAGQRLGAEKTDKKTDDKTPDKKDDKKSHPAVPNNLDQLAAMTQAAQPMAQGMQSIMQGVQQSAGGMGNTGAAPAKLADDTKKDDTKKPDGSPTGETHLVDATTKDADGATSGTQGSGSAPVQPATGGRPETTQSEIGL